MAEQENKQQVKGVMYEESKIQQVVSFLNMLPVAGINNINNMKIVFDILGNPIPFKNQEESKEPNQI